MKRRQWMLSVAAFAASAVAPRAGATALPEVLVYKSPTCGCCKDW